MSGAVVKRGYRYRFCPNTEQAVELSRTFGRVRLVHNRALDARTTAWRQEQRRVGYADTSALLTAWKQTEEPAFLNEVSSVPLQQCLRHLAVYRLAPVVEEIGVDAGLTALLTLSTGEKIANPRHEHREREALARAQRNLARKAKGSNNRAEARSRVARVHARIADRRRDLLPLGLREWTCPGCGEVHDRDVNAARNVLAAGRAVAACGGGIRPNRR